MKLIEAIKRFFSFFQCADIYEHPDPYLATSRPGETILYKPKPPHLMMVNGRWQCSGAKNWQIGREGGGGFHVAHGATPRLAYRMWKVTRPVLIPEYEALK